MGGALCTTKAEALQPTSSKISIKPSQSFSFINNLPSSMIGYKKGSIEDDYTFNTHLGNGSYGSVREVVHKVSGARRAVKIINFSNISETKLKNTQKEIEIMKKLRHPNILEIYEYYIDHGFLYIVLELCEGGELFEKLINEKLMSEAFSAGLIIQVLHSLNYCHQNRVIHRDLKPQNILFHTKDPNSALKVIDFGMAAYKDPQKKLKLRSGTPYFMAPEVIDGFYDEKCDIWSCGVILYIMLFGGFPFNGDNKELLFNNIKVGAINFEGIEWQDKSKELKNLLGKMLTVEPKNRITAEEAMNHKWFEKFSNDRKGPQKIKLTQETLFNIRKFCFQECLRLAIWSTFSSYMLMKEEKQNLINTFKKCDLNNDGKIAKDELRKILKKNFDAARIEDELKLILKNADINDDGFIDYKEFLIASANRRKMVTEDRISVIFKVFDQNKDGCISMEEFKNVFCGENELTSEQWYIMLDEVHIEAKDYISFEEFLKVVENFAEKDIPDPKLS